jgi:hypothetical protein
VRLLTCEEVSRAGWKLAVHGSPDSKAQVDLAAVIGNESVCIERIEGVITRLGHVGEEELRHIAAEDRPYVAAEMHAFLFAFLHALPCRVANPPSLACLYGPNLRAIQWRRYARELQIPVVESLAVTTPPTVAGSPEVDVTIVGERFVGPATERMRHWTRQLALACDLPYLRVRYRRHGDDVRFVGADAYPCLDSQDIGFALVQWLIGEGVAC